MKIPARLVAFGRMLAGISTAVWAACQRGRRRPSGRGAAGLDELRRRYVFGGITRSELEEGIRKIRGRFRRR